MKSSGLALTLGTLACTTLAHAEDAGPAAAPAHDAALAAKLGGDEYGMKNYVLVLLKAGPKDAEIKDPERAKLFTGHMKNIGRLADEGKLVVAGPFGKNDAGMRGLFILNVGTVEEAHAVVDTDPTVHAGIWVAELTPWYGSASLMATSETHKKIAKTKS